MQPTMADSFRTIFGLAGSLTATFLVVLSNATPSSSEIAAVFPPWWSEGRTFGAAAGAGRIVALGSFPSVLIVHGDPAQLAHDLRRAGALLTFASSLPAGCRTAKEAR